MKDLSINARYLHYGILEKWHDKTFDHFTNDDKAKAKIKKYLSKAKEAKANGVGLFLWGANGVGKSLCMNVAFKELVNMKFDCQIITLSTLITKFVNSWGSPEERDELYNRLLNVDFLGIEEIGKEFKGSTNLADVVLDSIIRYRLQRQLPVWATSNVKPHEINSSYTEDISSMFREFTVAVQITGEDYRNKIHKDLQKFVL